MSSTRKKSISQKNVERERTENRTLNRVYYVFLLGLAAECWLFLTYRIWAGSALSTGLKWFTALQVLMWLGLAALVNTGVAVMCTLVPIAAVLALVYLLYQHECALSTVALAGTMFSVWLRGASAASERWGILLMAGCIAAAAVLGAVIFLTSKAQKDEGKLWKIRVFSLECDYRVVYAVLAVAAVAMLVAAFLPAATVYLMWVLGVLLFAELVYYTTKLM